MNLKQFSTYTQNRVDQYLANQLSEYKPANQLHQAMRYSLFNGGKRIRPMLAYASAQLVGQINDFTDAAAAALESIHAYSLIHDDLPAMDDDDLRRGKPTCHIQFDEATAILAGDALQTFAFELLSQPSLGHHKTQLILLSELSLAAGRQGMISGQMLDLASENKDISLSALEEIHQHKTGALIRASVRMGALSTGQASEEQLQKLDQYAQAIGLAFQVQDDILDLTSDTQTLGKNQFSDTEANKATYPKLLGLEGAKALVLRLHKEALLQISDFGDKSQPLTELANYIIDRNH